MPVHDEKHEFSARLLQALGNAGFENPGATVIARKFNVLYPGEPVTPQAVRKWLDGTSIPSQDKIRVLARWLKVSAQWLRFGETPPAGKDVGEEYPANYSRRDLGEMISLLDNGHRQMIAEMVIALLALEGKRPA